MHSNIIAGKYKGKKIELPSLEVTRSSKSILKGSLFDTLQQDVIDTIFIEGFGGSGSIGLEALSRGAKKAYFCEIDRNSYKILQKNIKNIDPQNSVSIFGDSFVTLPELLNKSSFSGDDVIIYLDPPFDFRDGMEEIYQKAFKMVESFENENIVLVVFEHYSKLQMPENMGNFIFLKTKKFGKSSLSYYTKK
ncbi:16S rRNA (guanine(966)-N(2))-methyltransferase RsmD [Arcobacter sp. FWKO B]|uniref:16S rRNA (guanine(966)-N(2))-methyltransferase RsmD n=1 Tax=Arcobacter sp. FWKO B TaxID=2593672 RepID=UPI0018A439EF|nr:16S rRNA (guanine(966)-N(2))-methyltransferase RsmD [Arcobacter sp. FWKO B]QOG11432.1 16S rRNA (guanine(966)-N(2))-methyltransferase RsmD [Arcobacter sp. FWKO B]